MSGRFSSNLLDREEIIKMKDFHHHLNSKELKTIKDSFKDHDKNNANELDIDELRVELEKYGIDPYNEETLKNLFEEAERNGRVGIDFDKFIDVITLKMSDIDSMEELEKVFYLFLGEDNVDKIEFRHLRQLCPRLTDEEIEEMIKKADEDKDGKINFEEFYNIITKKI